eukprot:CAMPEP_0179066010 /NCGR_PEP_ID=MMETSP0796-20121207/28760_2 /TAXON_ID=73915 /ORGANISM="Pyrodinium bahamense, Strain pbaha01" /LENGTH=178 /DNA_ID=CAMNT_0020763009 /DNA_START=757 /DNA_END=1290 /DNA_ORIENTATION=-
MPRAVNSARSGPADDGPADGAQLGPAPQASMGAARAKNASCHGREDKGRGRAGACLSASQQPAHARAGPRGQPARSSQWAQAGCFCDAQPAQHGPEARHAAQSQRLQWPEAHPEVRRRVRHRAQAGLLLAQPEGHEGRRHVDEQRGTESPAEGADLVKAEPRRARQACGQGHGGSHRQ